ncbi:MAG: hypothetical protein WC505_07190 [Patescibacteria group bacterium]
MTPTENLLLRLHNTKVWEKPDGSRAYTEKGDGLHYYDKADKLVDADHALRDPELDDDKKLWKKISCSRLKVGFYQNISDSGWTVGYKSDGKLGKSIRLAPRRFGFYNQKTREFNWQSTAPISTTGEVVTSGKELSEVRYPNVFPDIDLAFVSQRGQFDQIFRVKAFNYAPTPTWSEDDTFVVFATEMDIPGAELAVDYGSAWLGEEVADASEIHFKDGAASAFHWADRTASRVATVGSDEKETRIVKKLMKLDGKYFLVEAVPYTFLKTADYKESPVLIDYTTKNGNETATQNWTAGTYHISAIYNMLTYDLNISSAAGDVIVKYASGNVYISFANTGKITATGSMTNKIYFTSAHDDTIGEAIAGSTGNPLANIYAGFSISRAAIQTDTFTGCVFRYAGSNLNCVFSVGGKSAMIFTKCEIAYCLTSSYPFVLVNNADTTVTMKGIFQHNCYGMLCNLSYNWGAFSLSDFIVIAGIYQPVVQALHNTAVAHTYTINNGLVLLMGGNTNATVTRAYGTVDGTLVATVTNVTVIGMHGGLSTDGVAFKAGQTGAAVVTVNVKRCIAVNCNTDLYTEAGAPDWSGSDYNCSWSNATRNIAGAHNILTSPQLTHSTAAVENVILNETMSVAAACLPLVFLGAASPCIDAGDVTAAAAGLDTKTTLATGVVDSGVCDLGFHHDAFSLPDFPDVANVRTTDTVNGVTGTCTIPAAGKLANGIQCGAAGTEVTGTRTDADPDYVIDTQADYGDPAALFDPKYKAVSVANVKDGVLFGPSSTLEGEFVGGGSNIAGRGCNIARGV